METTNQAASGNGDFVLTEYAQSCRDMACLAAAAWFRGPQQLAQLWLRIGAESWRFAGERLAAQAAFMSALSGCKDVEALALAETRFLDDTAEAISSEVDRLSEVAHEAAEAASRREAA